MIIIDMLVISTRKYKAMIEMLLAPQCLIKFLKFDGFNCALLGVELWIPLINVLRNFGLVQYISLQSAALISNLPD